MLVVRLLIGRERHALQTQFPPSSIELRNRPQLDLRAVHDSYQQTSQMLAPGRLLELIQDPRIMAATVANATTALTNGLSAANQKFIFILFILSIRRTIFLKIVEIGWTAGKGHVRMDSDAFCDPSKSAGSVVVCF
jgi:hypothetical protein